MKEHKAQDQTGPVCKCCGVKLHDVLTGMLPSPKGLVCEDCYYGMMSNEIEAHPPVHGSNRRG